MNNANISSIIRMKSAQELKNSLSPASGASAVTRYCQIQEPRRRKKRMRVPSSGSVSESTALPASTSPLVIVEFADRVCLTRGRLLSGGPPLRRHPS